MAEQSERQKILGRVTYRDVRLSYPTVFEPKAFRDGKPAYSAAFIIPKGTRDGEDMINDTHDAIDDVKDREWGKDTPKIKKSNNAFRDGDDDNGGEIDLKEEYKDSYVVAARNYKRPRVLDRDKSDLRESDGVIYGGCYVDAIVTFWAQDYEGTPRINCTLEGIRFRRDGEAFGAEQVTADDFDDLEDEGRERPSRRDRGDGREERSGRDRGDDRGGRGERSERRGDRDRGEDRPSREDRSERGGRDRGEDRSERGGRESRDDRRDSRDDRSERRGGRDDYEDRPSRNSRNGRSERDDDV